MKKDENENRKLDYIVQTSQFITTVKAFNRPEAVKKAKKIVEEWNNVCDKAEDKNVNYKKTVYQNVVLNNN